MKTTLTVAILLATAASLPAWAGEGAGDPFASQTVVAATTTTMTVRQGGAADPFQWSSAPVASYYTEKTGGAADPFQWSANPLPPAANRSATAATPSHG